MYLLTLNENINQPEIYYQYFKEEKLTDCEIIVKNHKILCHRIVLSSRSPYFEKIFKRNKETTSHSFPDFSKDIFDCVMELIYTARAKVEKSKIAEFKNLATKLQLDAFYEEVSSDDYTADFESSVDDLREASASNFYAAPELVSFEVNANSTCYDNSNSSPIINGSFSIPSKVKISDFDRTLSTTEASRRFRNNRPVRARKSLLNFAGPWKCEHCPQAPYFNSKQEKTAHELHCSFNKGAIDFLACDKCGRLYTRKTLLQQHLISKHL